MSSDLILMILKYAGTAMGGIAGIWGIVKETKDEKTKKLTPWGKCALSMAIAGFGVAVGSQIIEQIQNTQKEQAAKAKAAATEATLKAQLTNSELALNLARQQLGVSQTSATSIESARTRFDRISIRLSLELPVADPKVAKLVGDIRKVAEAPGSAHPKGINVNGGIMGDGSVSIDLRHMNDLPVLQKFPSLADFRSLFQAIDAKSQYAVINRPPRPYGPGLNVLTREKGDLDARNVAPRSADDLFRLRYESSPDRLFLDLSEFVCTAQDWTSSGKVVGTSDLPGSQFALMLYLTPAVVRESALLLNQVRAEGTTIRFGTQDFKPTKFKCYVTTEARMRALVFETFL